MRYRTSPMRFQIANRRQSILTFALSGVVGIVLSYGFIPLAHRLFEAVSLGTIKEWAFPCLSLAFFFSLKNSPAPVFSSYSNKRLITLCVLPLLISLGFGASKSFHSNLSGLHFLAWKPMLWTWLIVPMGEEFLFRGWMNSFLNRLSHRAFLGVTPLFPLSIWGSATAFSIWHFQNIETLGLGTVFFQLFYTFLIGIWLGFLRWQTNKLWPCILAHSLLNLTADWKLWFVL